MLFRSNPPTEQEMRDALADPDASGAEVDDEHPKVPNFVGKTLQDAIEEAAENAIELDISGDGLARVQNPPAGSALIPGEHIRVRFAR